MDYALLICVGVGCAVIGFWGAFVWCDNIWKNGLKRYIFVDKYLLDDTIVELWEEGKLIMTPFFHYKEKPKLKLVKEGKFNDKKGRKD